MPLMASVNKISLYIGIPALILIYASYLAVDYFDYDDCGRKTAIETHTNNMQDSSNIRGLILGGSNAVFGLSAEQMTHQIGMRFYNAAIINEGFNSSNYYSFIEKGFSEQQAKNIEIIFYSSILFIRNNPDKLIDFNKDIYGKQKPPMLLPSKPFGKVLQDLVFEHSNKAKNSYGNISTEGDFIFDAYKCAYDAHDSAFVPPNIKETIKYIEARLNFAKLKFPNARHIIVFPKEYDSLPKLRTKYFDQISSTLKAKKIEFIIQPHIRDVSLICDAKHHPNQTGRTLRTTDLIRQFDSLNR